MTVVTIGRLNGFNMLMVDTLVCTKEDDGRLRVIRYEDKLLQEDFAVTASGPRAIYYLMLGCKEFAPKFLHDRLYREQLVEFINANTHTIGTYQPENLTLYYINHEICNYLTIIYNNETNKYHLSRIPEEDITIMGSNDIRMHWFGYPVLMPGIDPNSLTITTARDIVTESMIQRHREERQRHGQSHLEDLRDFSSAIYPNDLNTLPVITHYIPPDINASLY